MGGLTNSQWWYSLAATVKDKAESFIGFCLFVANTLDGYPPEDE